nr:TraB/GumN family protein [Kofleriaceae bacterium]
MAIAVVAGCTHDDTAAKVTPPVVSAPATPETAPLAKGSAGSGVGSAAGSAAPVASGDPWAAKPVQKDPLKRVMMWSATKAGHTTYFLGTMHLGVDAEARMPDIVWKDFAAAPAFAMETDLTSPAAMKMATDIQRTSGTLHDDLGPAYWKKLQDALTPAVAKQVDHMKPFAPVTFLSMKGLPQTAPMDSVLRGRAETEHKQLVFLEDAAIDEAILEKWMDVKALKEMLDDLADTEKRQGEMLTAYLAGDDARLLALSDDERASAIKNGYTAAEYDAELDDLLYHRNASWIPALEKLHAAGGGFVAVGCLHLIGPKSVLELLKKDGFTVTRIEP